MAAFFTLHQSSSCCCTSFLFTNLSLSSIRLSFPLPLCTPSSFLMLPPPSLYPLLPHSAPTSLPMLPLPSLYPLLPPWAPPPYLCCLFPPCTPSFLPPCAPPPSLYSLFPPSRSSLASSTWIKSTPLGSTHSFPPNKSSHLQQHRKLANNSSAFPPPTKSNSQTTLGVSPEASDGLQPSGFKR